MLTQKELKELGHLKDSNPELAKALDHIEYMKTVILGYVTSEVGDIKSWKKLTDLIKEDDSTNYINF